jgi:hypothetical protein
VVRGHQHSGLTVREFCRHSKLHESAFYFWRGELQRRDSAQRQEEANVQIQQERRRRKRQRCGGSSYAPRPGAAPAFLPVTLKHEGAAVAPAGLVTVSPRQAGRIEIVLSGERRIHVTAPVDRQALADVLAVLDASAPQGQASGVEGRPC